MTINLKPIMGGSIPVGSYAMIYDIVCIKDASGRRFISGMNFTHPVDNLAGGGNYDSISDAFRSLLSFAGVGIEQARDKGWISAHEAMDAKLRIEGLQAGWEHETMKFELQDVLGISLTDCGEAGGNRKARRAAKAGRRR